MKKVSFNIFDFTELSDEIKDKVWKRFFLDSRILYNYFLDEVEKDLKYHFRYSTINVHLYQSGPELECHCYIYGDIAINDLIGLVSDELTEEEYYRVRVKDNSSVIPFSPYLSFDNVVSTFFSEKEDKLVSLICKKMNSICEDISNRYSLRLNRDDNFASNYFYKNDIQFFENGNIFDKSDIPDYFVNDAEYDDEFDRFN